PCRDGLHMIGWCGGLAGWWWWEGEGWVGWGWLVGDLENITNQKKLVANAPTPAAGIFVSNRSNVDIESLCHHTDDCCYCYCYCCYCCYCYYCYYCHS